MKLIRHAGDIMLRIADQSIAESYQHWLDAQDLAVIEQIRMPTASKPAPAWISKARVNRAGRRLRDKQPLTGEDYFVLEAWRKAHNHVLNTFQALLRNRTRERGIVVAQRLKRRWTINDKLHREPQMQLARMDDIAGCRMIFESWLRKSEHGDKWSFCLTAGKIDPRIRRDDEQTSTPDAHTGI